MLTLRYLISLLFRYDKSKSIATGLLHLGVEKGGFPSIYPMDDIYKNNSNSSNRYIYIYRVDINIVYNNSNNRYIKIYIVDRYIYIY